MCHPDWRPLAERPEAHRAAALSPGFPSEDRAVIPLLCDELRPDSGSAGLALLRHLAPRCRA